MVKINAKKAIKIIIPTSLVGAAIFGATELAKSQYDNSSNVKNMVLNATVSQAKIDTDAKLSTVEMNNQAWRDFIKLEYNDKMGGLDQVVAQTALNEFTKYIMPIYSVLDPTSAINAPTWFTVANQNISTAVKNLFLHDPFTDPIEIFKNELYKFITNHPNFSAANSQSENDLKPLVDAINAHLQDPTKLDQIKSSQRYNDLEQKLSVANISFHDADDAFSQIFGQTFNFNMYEFFHQNSSTPKDYKILPTKTVWYEDDAKRLDHFIEILLREVKIREVENYYAQKMTIIGEAYKQKLSITSVKKFNTDVDNILSKNKTLLFNRVEKNVDKTKSLDEQQVLSFLPYENQPENSQFTSELNTLVSEYEADVKSLENYITKQVSSAAINHFIQTNIIKATELFDKKQSTNVGGTTINVDPLTWFMNKYQIDKKDIDNVVRVTTGSRRFDPAYKNEVFDAQYSSAMVSTNSNFTSAQHTIEITTNVTDMIDALKESQKNNQLGDLIPQIVPSINQTLPVTITDLQNMVGSSAVDINRLENFAGDVTDANSFSGIIKHYKDNVLPNLSGKVTAVKSISIPNSEKFEQADMTFEFTDSVNTAPITLRFSNVAKELPKTAKELANSVDKLVDKKYIDLEEAKKVLNVVQANTMNFAFKTIDELEKIGLLNIKSANWSFYKIEGTFTYTMGTFVTDLKYTITSYKDAKNTESRTVKVSVKELDEEKANALIDIDKSSKRFTDKLDELSSGPDAKITAEQKNVLKNQILQSIDAAKLAVGAATDASAPEEIAEKISSEVMKKALPAIYFLNTQPGQEAVKQIFPDFSKFDINNPDFANLLKIFSKVYESDAFKDVDWSNLSLEKFKELADKLSQVAKNININTIQKINTAVLATMVALGGVFGLVGVGTGISSVITAKADKKLKQRTNSVVKFQGIKKLLSFQSAASLLSLGMATIMVVYVFVIKGGF